MQGIKARAKIWAIGGGRPAEASLLSRRDRGGRGGTKESGMSAVPEINTEKCTGCGTCIEGCPTSAVEVIDGKAAIVRPEDCNYCTDCEALCPSAAIECPFEIILKRPGNSA